MALAMCAERYDSGYPRQEVLLRHVAFGVIANRTTRYDVTTRISLRVVDPVDAIPCECAVPASAPDLARWNTAIGTSALSYGDEFIICQPPEQPPFASRPAVTLQDIIRRGCARWMRTAIRWARIWSGAPGTSATACVAASQRIARDYLLAPANAPTEPCGSSATAPGARDNSQASVLMSDSVNEIVGDSCLRIRYSHEVAPSLRDELVRAVRSVMTARGPFHYDVSFGIIR